MKQKNFLKIALLLFTNVLILVTGKLLQPTIFHQEGRTGAKMTPPQEYH